MIRATEFDSLEIFLKKLENQLWRFSTSHLQQVSKNCKTYHKHDQQYKEIIDNELNKRKHKPNY